MRGAGSGVIGGSVRNLGQVVRQEVVWKTGDGNILHLDTEVHHLDAGGDLQVVIVPSVHGGRISVLVHTRVSQ